MHIIFESVLMLPKIMKISPCLSRLRLVKVGTFFSDTVYVQLVKYFVHHMINARRCLTFL